MLPEFIDATDAIQASLEQEMLEGHRKGTGAFSRARRRIYHEGERFGGERDGKDEHSEFAHFESAINLKLEDLMTMTPEDFKRRFRQMGQELGDQSARFHWEMIRDMTDRCGSVVERERDESIVESIFKLTESAQMSFEDGSHGFTLYVPPDEYDAVMAAQDEILRDPGLLDRMNRLMQSKYEDWRAEEANRKLVD